MDHELTAVERRIVETLRAARGPLRESALHGRLNERAPLDPDLMIAALERLATTGHVRVGFRHDGPTLRDPAPFAPRYWRLIE